MKTELSRPVVTAEFSHSAGISSITFIRGAHSRKLDTETQREVCTLVFTVVLSRVAKGGETQVPTDGGRANKMLCPDYLVPQPQTEGKYGTG